MAAFSVESALGAGFSVIRRKPLALLVWAAVYLAAYLAPLWAIYTRLASAGTIRAAQHGAVADPQAAIQVVAGLMTGWTPVFWLMGLAVMSVLWGAVFRAVLTPQDDRYFYLRVGLRELWLGLTVAALEIVFILGGATAFVALGVMAQAAPWYATVLAAIALLVGLIWMLMRLSLSAVIAFAESRFVFWDSWALTEGQVWRLFVVLLGLAGIIMLGELVLLVPIGLALVMTGAAERLATSPSLAPPGLVMAVIGVAVSLFAAAVYAVVGAPWASVYQQLTGAGPPRRPFSLGEAVPVD